MMGQEGNEIVVVIKKILLKYLNIFFKNYYL